MTDGSGERRSCLDRQTLFKGIQKSFCPSIQHAYAIKIFGTFNRIPLKKIKITLQKMRNLVCPPNQFGVKEHPQNCHRMSLSTLNTRRLFYTNAKYDYNPEN